MQETKHVTIISNKKKVVLNVSTILYVLMMGNNADIHVSGGTIYKTRMTFREIEEKLGDGFIKIHRGGIVSAMAIHDITDKINLSNGESLIYTQRKKNQIIEQFHAKQKRIISSFSHAGIPVTDEEYRSHYSSFENLPFAFTDIEMIFNEKRQAVDWIFRYGNPALAKLEKMPLERIIGSSFGITTDTIFTESATIYAHWKTDTQHEIDFEGVGDTEYTIVVKVADYLPADAAITTMSGSLPAVGKNQNITYTSNVSESFAMLYTKICDKPTTYKYTVTVYTSNYGTITITVNISLLGYKINSYDTYAKSASVSFKEAGTHSVIFASYNGSQLSGIDIVDYAVKAGGTFDVSQKDISFTANKIMLWQDMTGLVPLCDAYIVK